MAGPGRLLAATSVCPPEKQALAALADDADAYAKEVLGRRVTVLDLLSRYPSCQLTFASYLQMLAPLHPAPVLDLLVTALERRSRHADRGRAVRAGPVRRGHLRGRGVDVPGARPAGQPGRGHGAPVERGLPPADLAADPDRDGLRRLRARPFRGFLQDRALAAQEAGERPAPALLFFGCDAPDVDYLYSDELAAWIEQGVVDVRPAFSEAPEDGVRFVQDRIWADREDVRRLIKDGGTFFVCGDGRRMAPAVFDTCARIYAEVSGTTQEEAEAWLTQLQQQHSRYVADVFA